MSNALKSRSAFPLAMLGAPWTSTSSAAKNHTMIKLKELGLVAPIAGGAPGGYNTGGDVITQTADGRDLNALWTEFQTTLGIYNAERQTLVDLLTFSVTNNIEDVPQLGGGDFEKASEFGVPRGIRPTLGYFSMGYTFDWYDIATRYTWQFLAEASAQQVEAVHQSVLEADSRLMFREVMATLFNNTNRSATINGQNYNVFALYNADGTVPPAYKNTTFDGTHNHYIVSGAATVDSKDLEDLSAKLDEHGYTAASGVSKVVLVNQAEGQVIRTFRANVVNNNSVKATYDFIPAVGSAPFLLPGTGLQGAQPANNYRGLTVIGSYGDLTIVEEGYIPAGYMVLLGTGGPNSLQNPVGIREHANAGMRGLRLLQDTGASGYPLKDAYYSRGFGTGIRQRGGSAIMQIKASGNYDVPAVYARS